MPAFAPLRHFLLKKATLAAAALLVGFLLFAWLALPFIIQAQAQRHVAAATGHRLMLDKPAINPFKLSLRLANLSLHDPAGQPLLACDSLLVDVSAASLLRRAWVFDAIRIERPAVTLVEQADGRLNWSALLEGLGDQTAPPAPTGQLPRLEIRSLDLVAGSLDFADRRATPGFAAQINPIDLELQEIATFPDDSGRFRLAARTAGGATLELAGALALAPLAVSGNIKLAGLKLAQFHPYLAFLPVPPQGELEVAADYRVGNGGAQLDAVLERIEARLAGLRLPLGKDEQAAALAIDSLGLADGRIDLAQRVVEIGALRLAGGQLRATRAADGRIDLLDALGGQRPAPDAAAASPPWRYRLDKFEAAGLGIELRDAAVTPAAVLALDDVALEVTGISEDRARPLPVKLALTARQGGRFEAQGSVVPGGPTVQLKLKFADFALQPLQPYLAEQAALVMTSGRFESAAELRYAAAGFDYRGEFAVRDLRLAAQETGATFLAWKTLGSRDLHLSTEKLAIGELRLNGLDTQLVIDKDKSVNLKKILRGKAAAPPAAQDGPVRRPFVVAVERLRFYNGEMDFADLSLLLPFGTRIHGMRGSLGPISNLPGAPAQIELEGAVDDYGMARAVGQVDLFKPTEFMDLRVIFRNVEMTRLTPYAATFAGRRIDSGKLSLDLQYRIKERRLQGENQVVMERLVLGERVASPSARDLPLDLAIAVLQDGDGRIDLGLPVTGNLDDPEFSYGQIVWKAIVNVLTRAATAPFRALAALFGGGASVDSIAFEAGAAVLTPPEREKLLRMAEVLAQRPALVLAVGGQHAESDRLALQDVQLRRAIAMQMGQRVSEQWDPGALSTSQPKVREAIEALYKARIGAAELAALKEGFRRANPGQLEESVAGRMLSRLSGLLQERKTLNEDEVTRLKGADLHAELFERLRAREAVADEQLRALAQARGATVIDALTAAGVAAARLQALPPEHLAEAAATVPVRLAFAAAK